MCKRELASVHQTNQRERVAPRRFGPSQSVAANRASPTAPTCAMSVACHNGVALPHSDTWIDSSSSNVETSPPVKVYLCTPSEWCRARRRAVLAVQCSALHRALAASRIEQRVPHNARSARRPAAAQRVLVVGKHVVRRGRVRVALFRARRRVLADSVLSNLARTRPSHANKHASQSRPMAADLHGGAAGGILRGVRVGAGRAVVVAVRQREALAEACTRSTPLNLPSTWWLTDTGEIRCRRL